MEGQDNALVSKRFCRGLAASVFVMCNLELEDVRALARKGLVDLAHCIGHMQELTVWQEVAEFLSFWAGVLSVAVPAFSNVDDSGSFAWPAKFPPVGKFFVAPHENLPVPKLLEKFTIEEEGDMFNGLVASIDLVQQLLVQVPEELSD
ncbi:unnamed protein product [Symbiodinium sp. CCMP2592]|nr:unnamed protein product [Symbiodinium sp. CCMP2592]